MHGGKDTVNFLCDEPRVKAISFVGGDLAGKHIWDRAGSNGKRVQANLGAKSEERVTGWRERQQADSWDISDHCIVMPDADKEAAMSAIAGAAFGAAGRRCVALSVMIAVGEAREWVPELVRKAKELNVGNGFEDGVDMCVLLDRDHVKRTEVSRTQWTCHLTTIEAKD
jgi:malonate-semialdehyde dehydrogenase (acetylating)/methylmalonate-semialdehyde dehydrogenase